MVLWAVHVGHAGAAPSSAADSLRSPATGQSLKQLQRGAQGLRHLPWASLGRAYASKGDKPHQGDPAGQTRAGLSGKARSPAPKGIMQIGKSEKGWSGA